MELNTHISSVEMAEYGQAMDKMLRKRKPRKRTKLELLIAVFVYVGVGIAYYHYQHSFTWPAFIILTVVFVALHTETLLTSVRIAQTVKYEDDGLLLGQHHYAIGNSGISANGKAYDIHVNWSLVRGILETKGVFIIVLDGMAAFLLAKKDVSDMETLREMVSLRMKGQPY